MKGYKTSISIIGGGPVGSSIAYHLAKFGFQNITVIERDKTYKIASSMLSAGGIRQQFSLKENILMSEYGARFVKNATRDTLQNNELPDVQFHENGYLFLATQPETLLKNHETQRSCGIDWMKIYNPQELKENFPWLNSDGIALGSYGTRNEGYFDPWGFVAYLKQQAIDLGVKYLDGEVVDANMTTTTSSISSQNISVITEGNVKSLIIRNIRTKEVTSLSTEYIVSAAGAWSNSLLSAITQSQPNMKVFNLPIRPKKRCIFIVQCPVTSVEFLSSSSSSSTSVPPLTTPLVIDPSGVYFRPEGVKGRFITGVSPLPEDDPDCEGQAEELENVDNKQFEDIIWPALYERVPAFEKLKVIGSWAGFYDYNTFDQNAIIGYHPNIKNLLVCTGFSGHGLQHAPAAGLAVSELLGYGFYKTIDLNRFSFDRLIQDNPVLETGIV